MATALPNWNRRGFDKFPFGEKCVRTVPAEDLTHGFFVALFVKKDEKDIPTTEASSVTDVVPATETKKPTKMIVENEGKMELEDEVEEKQMNPSVPRLSPMMKLKRKKELLKQRKEKQIKKDSLS